VSLAPYMIAGQPILKYTCSYLDCGIQVLSSGTSSDTASFDPVGTVWYVFPNDEASEYVAAVISVGLEDVSNASKIVIRYAYTPYPLNHPDGNGRLNVFDCGSGTCAFPADPRIGTVYYRLFYLAANGALLAASDQQTL